MCVASGCGWLANAIGTQAGCARIGTPFHFEMETDLETDFDLELEIDLELVLKTQPKCNLERKSK